MSSPTPLVLNSPDFYASPSLDLPWDQDLVALRRDFHAHPELGYQEVRTSGIVAARLKALGYEIREGLGKTGVRGILRGNRPGPCVLLRADMDALPMNELNDWAWRSTSPGKMHACGHDAHTAILLTVARQLAAKNGDFPGTVVLMFQPAEEGLGGAGKMIEDGLLEDPRPDFALALHVWSTTNVGEISVAPGPVMACADSFRITLQGKGGHGAMPHQTTDAVVMGAHLVSAIQSIVARNLAPLKAGVVTIGSLHAGTTYNVIPGEATLEGTIRAFDEESRSLLENRLRQLVETLPQAFGGKGLLAYERGYPPTVNAPGVVDRVRPAFASVVGTENVTEFEPTMAAEDMSMVLQTIPGCYFFVGARNPEVGAVYPHHHPRFTIDENCLSIAVRAFLSGLEALQN